MNHQMKDLGLFLLLFHYVSNMLTRQQKVFFKNDVAELKSLSNKSCLWTFSDLIVFDCFHFWN